MAEREDWRRSHRVWAGRTRLSCAVRQRGAGAAAGFDHAAQGRRGGEGLSRQSRSSARSKAPLADKSIE